MLILHLSDIHFRHPECNTHADPDGPYRTLMQGDIRFMVDKLAAPIDAIVVTGDIACRGKAEEFQAAERWLTELASEFGHPKSTIFVVPGNHDVDRGICRQGDVRNVQHMIRNAQTLPQREAELKGQLEHAATSRSIYLPIEAYNDFARKFDCNLFAPQRNYWRSDIELEHGAKLRLHGWNSTLLSGFEGNDDERGSMFIGRIQTVVHPEDGVVNAVLAHHPPSWCRDEDDIDNKICAFAHLHFFGHKHRQRVDQHDTYIRYAAGAVNPNPDELGWEPGYNLIELKVVPQEGARALQVKSHVRRYRSGDSTFEYGRPPTGATEWYFKELPIRGAYRLGATTLTPKVDPPVSAAAAAPAVTTPPADTVRDRDLVYRFWSLPMSGRRDIANALGLLEPGEMQLKESERYGRALLRAKERGLIDRLASEITRNEVKQ